MYIWEISTNLNFFFELFQTHFITNSTYGCTIGFEQFLREHFYFHAAAYPLFIRFVVARRRRTRLKNKIGPIDFFLVASWRCSVSALLAISDTTKLFLIRPILFLYYEENLVSSSLNSNLLRFHCAHPIVHAVKVSTSQLVANLN